MGESRGTEASKVKFVSGDIAEAAADAIVNPVSSGFLVGFGGVNGALRAAGGAEYRTECDRLPTTAGGDVWATGAGSLKARYVLHVVSPIWSSGKSSERDALRRAHERILEVADDLGCRSIALPAIGCGAHRFPVEVAASMAVSAVENALVDFPSMARVEFWFRSRSVCHDYALRSQTYDAESAQVAILRDDIVHLVRNDPELVAAVAQIGDEAELRAIDAAARELSRELQDSSTDIAFIYRRAAREVLHLEPPRRSVRPTG